MTENNRNGGSPANGGLGVAPQDGKKMLEDYFAKKEAQEGWGNK